MQCPLCSSEESSLLHDRVWSSENGRVFRCQNCDVTYIHPMMDVDQEREFYKQYNKHVKQRGVSVSGSAAELHEKSQAAARERYAVVEDIFLSTNNVLEVGAATGAFIQQLKGKACSIVEPADDNRQFAQQFADKAYGDLSDIPADEYFDVICMFHVFEHIREPQKFLESCRKHLTPGGMIVIEVPHIEDPLISLYDCHAYKDFYFQPMHPFIHSLASLRSIFLPQGFRERQVIYHQRYGLVNHLNWLAQGKPGGNDAWLTLLGDNESYKAALEKSAQTDTIYYVAEVPGDI